METTETETITSEALAYLQQRMEIRSQSICKKFFPIEFGGSCASVSKTQINLPIPKDISTSEILKTYAFQIHESSHVEFGSLDFKKAHKVISDNNLDFKKAHNLLNIIEDYRVNTLQLYSHSGAGKLMEVIHKDIVKDRVYNDDQVVDAILPVVSNYPTGLDLTPENQFKLNKAVALIKPVKKCYDLTMSLDILPKIYDIFYERPSREDEDSWDKEWRERRELKKLDNDKELTGIKKASAKSNSKKAIKKMEKCEAKAKLEATDGTPTSDTDSIPEKSMEESKEIKTIKKEIEEITKEVQKIQADAVSEEKVKMAKFSAISKNYEKETKMLTTHTFVRTKQRAEYEKIKRQHRNDITILTRNLKTIMTFNKRWTTGQKAGKLDTRKVYKIVSNGNSNVFKQKVHKDVGNIAILLLVDCSGSMANKKEIQARKATIILHEVLRNLKIKHMIVGYSADEDKYHNSTNHLVYKDWNDRGVAYNLPGIEARSQNRDGDTINIATKYFKNIAEKRKLTIVISDGKPWANKYQGNEAVNHTIDAQKAMTKKGIKLINVGIGEYFRMPDKYINKVKVDDVSKLSTVLMKVVKRELGA